MIGGSGGAMKKISSEMKLAPRKIAGVAVASCLLLPCIFLAILKPNFSSFPFWNLQPTIRTTVQLAHVEAVTEDANGSSPKQSGTKMTRIPDSYKEMQSGSNPTVIGTGMKTMPLALKEETRDNQSSNPFSTSTKMKPSSLGRGENKSELGNQGIQFFHVLEENTKPKNLVSRNLVLESKLWCDISQERSDTCFMNGDVRIHGPSFSLVLALPSQLDDSFHNQTWKIRPYARKWESPVMETINEL